MRILVLTQVLIYPADAGPKIKTLHVVRHLAEQHEIIYCTFVRGTKEAQTATTLRPLCEVVATVPMKRSRMSDARFLLESLIVGDSFLLRRDERAAMHTMVQTLLREHEIDAIHVDQLNMMRFVPRDWAGIVILDEHNAVWQVVERLWRGTRNPLKRWLLKREVRLLKKLEGAACRQATIVLAVSAQDRQALRVVADDARIEVVPITLDVAHFAPIRAARKPQSANFFTVGTMFWPPNSEGIQWWLDKGYEQLQAIFPSVTYDIVGAKPPASLQRLASTRHGVQVRGYVADVAPFWTHTTALLVPILSGGGVRVKILEAMAMGVPVISTTLGCEGLAVRDGEHLLIADTPEAMVTACSSIIQNPYLAEHLMRNAFLLVCEQYDIHTALQYLDTMYESFGQTKTVR